jgi:uncharacterized protein
MDTAMHSYPPSDEDNRQLAEILLRYHHEGAMSLEAVDGFFAALVCAPALVPPSGYLPEILGDERPEPVWKSQEEAQRFFDLMMHYWNGVVSRLSSGEAYLPYLLEHPDGSVSGNDWAHGFMRGVALGEDDWREFFRDENEFGLMIPILALHHEHDPDPEMRSYAEPVSAELREKLLAGLSASVMEIYRRLAPAREMNANARAASAGSVQYSKIGRNEPCPCGSGKKYKRCCGGATIQ